MIVLRIELYLVENKKTIETLDKVIEMLDRLA